jgi:hypothetical protein
MDGIGREIYVIYIPSFLDGPGASEHRMIGGPAVTADSGMAASDLYSQQRHGGEHFDAYLEGIRSWSVL